MADQGYCTVDDVRRAMREKDLPGDAAQDKQIVVDAITSQSEWLQETTMRHWYEPNGITEDSQGIIPTGPRTHTEDEQDLPTRAFLTTEPETRENTLLFDTNDAKDHIPSGGLQPQTHRGPFTRIVLARRDVTSLSELLVLHSENGYEDWAASTDYTEGRAGDYYVQADDSSGKTKLYLDTNAIDSELEHYGNTVLATYDYGIEGITSTVRRATALLAAVSLVIDDDAALGIPENANLTAVDSKVDVIEREAERLLEIHR